MLVKHIFHLKEGFPCCARGALLRFVRLFGLFVCLFPPLPHSQDRAHTSRPVLSFVSLKSIISAKY